MFGFVLHDVGRVSVFLFSFCVFAVWFVGDFGIRLFGGAGGSGNVTVFETFPDVLLL